MSDGRRAGRRALGDHPSQAVEQQIRRGGRRRRFRQRPGRGRDLASITRHRQTTGEQGGGERLEVDLAGPSSVERLEVLGGGEQQPRRIVATLFGERDARAKQIQLALAGARPSAPRLGVRRERDRFVERAGLVLRLARRRARARPDEAGQASGPRSARGTRRPRRTRRAPALAPPNARAPRRRPRPASTSPARDAMRGGRGRSAGPWPPRALDAPRFRSSTVAARYTADRANG